MTDKSDTLLMDATSIERYAENGALHYAQHIINNTSFKKAIAFGCSGTEKENLKIRPIYVYEKGYMILPMVRDFSDFSDKQIGNYIQTRVLKNKSEAEIEFEQIMKSAEQLHEDLPSARLPVHEPERLAGELPEGGEHPDAYRVLGRGYRLCRCQASEGRCDAELCRHQCSCRQLQDQLRGHQAQLELRDSS